MATKWHTHKSPCCSLVISEKDGSFSEKVIEFESKEAKSAWETADQLELGSATKSVRPLDSSHEDIENNIAHQIIFKKR